MIEAKKKEKRIIKKVEIELRKNDFVGKSE